MRVHVYVGMSFVFKFVSCVWQATVGHLTERKICSSFCQLQGPRRTHGKLLNY